jgi:glycosyltransferase involved in cell wall biosynthesis
MIGPSYRREGAPISQFELVTGLNASGIDLRVMAPEGGDLLEGYRAEGVEAHIDLELKVNTADPQAYESDIERLSQHLRSLEPAVVFANTLDQFPVIDAARHAGLPSLWNIREGEPWRVRLADRHPAVARRALACFVYPVKVIFVAEEGRSNWRRFAPKPDNTDVIPNAPRVKPAVLSPEEREALRARAGVVPGELLAICVGTISERKGQADLAAALGKLPIEVARTWRVAFVGPDPDNLSSRVRVACPPELRDRLVFVGEVADAAPWYAASDVCVLLSRSEAMARALLEAAAAGRAILTTPVGAAPDWFEAGKSVLFVSPRNPSAAAAGLVALTDDLTRARLGAAAQKLVETLDFSQLVSRYRDHVMLAYKLPVGRRKA